MYVVKGAPPAVVKRLFSAVQNVMRDPWVIERLASGGAEIITSKSLEDCAGFMQTQNEFWAALVKRVGVVGE